MPGGSNAAAVQAPGQAGDGSLDQGELIEDAGQVLAPKTPDLGKAGIAGVTFSVLESRLVGWMTTKPWLAQKSARGA